MLVHEYYVNNTLNKLMFRVSANELRVTKNINNSLYHITKEIEEDITHKQLMRLIHRFTLLDNVFWVCVKTKE